MNVTHLSNCPTCGGLRYANGDEAQIAEAEARTRCSQCPSITYEGTPCLRAGHTTRYISNGTCVGCRDSDNARYRAKNREAIRARDVLWYTENRRYDAHYRAEKREYQHRYDYWVRPQKLREARIEENRAKLERLYAEEI